MPKTGINPRTLRLVMKYGIFTFSFALFALHFAVIIFFLTFSCLSRLSAGYFREKRETKAFTFLAERKVFTSNR